MSIEEESGLISAILNGDVQAFAVLVRRYQRPIYNLLLRMTGCGEQAADLAQEAFLKAYQNLERFRLSRRFFPWLYTIAMNLARDHRRSLKARSASEQGEPRGVLTEPGAIETRLVERLDSERVGALLASLPEDYREALILRFHEGLGMHDIGQALGVSTSGAKMRISRGLEKLRQMLGDPSPQ